MSNSTYSVHSAPPDLELAEKIKADIVIGTDPDSDRLGVAVRDDKDELILLNGNQTMIMMTDYLLKKHKAATGFKGHEFIASTIVSTPMMAVLAKAYDVDYKEGLTGFKWIAKMIKDHPNQYFIGGGEESFGFMVGDFVRDKDAVTATLLACEIAAEAKSRGSSFYSDLIELYRTHGFFKERLVSFTKKGIDGAREIKQMMIDAREQPKTEIGGAKVTRIDDYQLSVSRDVIRNTDSKITIPKSNVLIYHTEDGSKIALRPSGTEPKIKFYISVQSRLQPNDDFDRVNTKLEIRIDEILKAMDLS